MKKIFYRQRFLESPTLVFFMACVMITSFTGSFIIDFFVALWQILIFMSTGILIKRCIRYIPFHLHYSFVAIVAVTIMTISYQVATLLTPSLSIIYHLIMAVISSIAIIIAYIDYIFYDSSLVSNSSIALSITAFLILFTAVLIFAHYVIGSELAGHALEHYYQGHSFWLTLAGRLTLLSIMLFLLKHLFRREY